MKFLVDAFDKTGETVAQATILTMVKRLDQSLDFHSASRNSD